MHGHLNVKLIQTFATQYLLRDSTLLCNIRANLYLLDVLEKEFINLVRI